MKVPTYVTHLDQLPGALPTKLVPQDVDVQSVGTSMVSKLANLSKDLFTPDALWRDQLAMCGTLRTFFSPSRIMPSWHTLSVDKAPTDFKVVEGSARNSGYWVDVRFTFRTQDEPKLSNSGILYLVQNGEEWKIWLLCTIAEDIIGHEFVDLRKTNKTDNQVTKADEDLEEIDLDVLIVGGGQSGLGTGAWCKSVSLKYVIIERNARIGDNWLNRYKSAKLHTGHRFNDLPFGPTFTKDDPEWLTTKALADGYNRFVKQFDFTVWTSAIMQGVCEWQEDKQLWSLKLQHNGRLKTIRSKYLVLATGPGGQIPLKPNLPGEESFEGTVIHSIDYQSAEAWKGKKAIVVGTANTAHDVAVDMYEAECSSVTMLQRGSTYVVPRKFFKMLFDYVWNDSHTQEVGDRLFWSPPTGVSRLLTNSFFHSLHDQEPELEDALDKIGFRTLRHADFLDHLLIRFGGHYMNVGGSEKLIAGDIKVKGDSPLIGFTKHGIQFGDGSELPADVVVFATGFEKDVKYSAAQIIGDKLAGNLERYWGVDEEGEIGLAFKPGSVKNFFVAGGGCAHARYFTRFIALQIKAAVLGTPLKLYQDSPVED